MESSLTFTFDLDVPLTLLHPGRLTDLLCGVLLTLGGIGYDVSLLTKIQNLRRLVGGLITTWKAGMLLLGRL